MKTITFSYTKKGGAVSDRTLLALVVPGDKYAGIDLSELDPADAAAFAKRAKELNQEYIEAMFELQSEFELLHSYRQFLASGMTDVTEI